MTGNPQVRFRAPEGLIEAVETVAEEEGLTNSEAYRDLVRRGLADLGADGLDYVAKENLREQIIEEELPRKREAWFRSNVGGRLLKCWNAGLNPDEAEQDLKSYHREATELFGRDDLAQYVTEGMNVYRDAYPDNGAQLSAWVKSRTPDDADPSAFDTDHAEGEVVDDAEAVIDRTMNLEIAADVWATNVRTGVVDSPEEIDAEDVANVDADAEEVRQAVRDRLDADAEEGSDDE